MRKGCVRSTGTATDGTPRSSRTARSWSNRGTARSSRGTGSSHASIISALLRPLGAGCPAIAADTPFNREVLERDDGGRCGSTWRHDTELRDAIGEFEGDLRLVESLREPCRRQIRENFSWDLVTDQYEVFYRGFVERWPVERIRAEVAAQKVKYATRT